MLNLLQQQPSPAQTSQPAPTGSKQRLFIGGDDATSSTRRAILQELLLGLRQSISHERDFTLNSLKESDLLWKGKHWDVGMGAANITGNLGYLGPRGYSPKRARYVLNYYKADCLRLVGILGLPPATKAALFDENPSLLNETASLIPVVDQLISRITNHWKLHLRVPDIIFQFFYSGNVFFRTSYQVDGFRFGRTAIPNIESKEVQVSDGFYVCPQCQNTQMESEGSRCKKCGLDMGMESFVPPLTDTIPQVTGQQEYNNGGVVCYLSDGYTTFTNIDIESFDDAKWLVHDISLPWSNIVATYPELQVHDNVRSMYRAGPKSNSYHAHNSQGRYGNTGVAAVQSKFYEKAEHTEFWLYPHMYEELIDRDREQRNWLHNDYPYGVKITCANGIPIYLEPERLHSVWAGARPTTGPGWYTRPLGDQHTSGNLLINDLWSMNIELGRNAIPIKLFNPNALNMQQITAKGARPDWIPAIPNTSNRMSDYIWESSPSQIPPGVQQLLPQAIEMLREAANLPSSMFGNGPVDQTAAGTEIRRNMGMLPHSNTWLQLSEFIARGQENAIRQDALHSPGNYAIFCHRPGIVEAVQLPRLKELTKGGWYIKAGEKLPLTPSQERAQIDQMLSMGTDVLKFLGLDTPKNVRKIQDVMGLKGFSVTGYEDNLAVIDLIRQLLASQPSQNPQTGEFEPSIPMEPDIDDHELLFISIRDWLRSPEAKRYKGSPGYANVAARMMQHKNYTDQMAMMQQQQQQQQQPMPPEDGGAGAGAGGAGNPPAPGAPGMMVPSSHIPQAQNPSGLPLEGLPLPEDNGMPLEMQGLNPLVG